MKFFVDVNNVSDAEDVLNDELGGFFARNKRNKNSVYMDNLSIFRDMASSFVKRGKGFFDKHSIKPLDEKRATQCENLEKVQLVEAFYKKMNVDINATGLYESGTISFKTPEENVNAITKKDSNGNITVTVTDNGLLSDSAALTHELSHFMNNNPNINGTTVSNNLLGEPLADTYQLLFADFLSEKGFTYEGDCIKLLKAKGLFDFANQALPMLKVLVTYDVFHEVSYENYAKLFAKNTEEYKNGITSLANFVYYNEEKYVFNVFMRYMVDFGLSIYMYTQYKKDNSFGEKLKMLNNAIARSNDYDRCLKMIGIKSKSFPDDDSIIYIASEKVLESIDEYCQELEEILQRNPSLQNDMEKGIAM